MRQEVITIFVDYFRGKGGSKSILPRAPKVCCLYVVEVYGLCVVEHATRASCLRKFRA